MVKACKGYITDDGQSRIWDHPRDEVIEKIQVCIKLYEDYKSAFYKAKQKINDTPGERPFEFSEMYIFGKFEAFCKRLSKVSTLFG